VELPRRTREVVGLLYSFVERLGHTVALTHTDGHGFVMFSLRSLLTGMLYIDPFTSHSFRSG
jgi:hypothetical protein